MENVPIKIYVTYVETDDYKGYHYMSYYPIEKYFKDGELQTYLMNEQTFDKEIQPESIREIIKYK